ncbi:proline-rich transmembrane protein 4 [Thalassophryne amazonica]|uniref:proline-rich transmembrane protein 4 n=1 Tax=Thalassophryne amazonica TaxID=390379 RepID=UPI0014723166|nr:proline-rich transmembrane protein 4 [Thalassophryne amazonica]
MYPLWSLLFLSVSLLVKVEAEEHVKEPKEIISSTVAEQATRPSEISPTFMPENGDFLSPPFSWIISSLEETDGVLGEYADLQMNPSGKWPTESSSSGRPAQNTKKPNTKTSAPTLHPAETEASSARWKKSHEHRLPFPQLSSIPSNRPDQDTVSVPSAGPEPSPAYTTTSRATGKWGMNIEPSISSKKQTRDGLYGATDHILDSRAVSTEADKGMNKFSTLILGHPPFHKVFTTHCIATFNSLYLSLVDDRQDSRVSETLLLDSNMDLISTPCKNPNQSWTPIYADDFSLNEPLQPSLALTPPLLVPLYSDWNSAFATWGIAWEAHVYGLGSVFTLFGLISLICLFSLSLRCPPGSLYFTLLHLLLVAFAGVQAFCLLYDAYSHQDRLPPLGSLLLFEMLFPCLSSAFSVAFHLLSLRSCMHVPLPPAISTSFSALPRPCFLLCMSLLHLSICLGCVGVLQLLPSLPSFILLLPQGIFIFLSIFLSSSYLIFYCMMRVNTDHIYRLKDIEESGGSPEVLQPVNCPFVKVEDWDRAAAAGVWASLCLLGCGGLQLYGILHALGLGGSNGYGFQPWPWWGYQVGCRLCEAGVCLSLSVIGTHPLFCCNSSVRTITHPQSGSWSRLSCSSPLRGTTLPSQRDVNSPVLSPDSWSQDKQERVIVCNVISKGQSEAVPLCSVVGQTGNGRDCAASSNVLCLPTPPCPPHNPKSVTESHLSSLDSLGREESDSTVDLQPPSPIDLSSSIDQALCSDSLFSHSLFGWPRLFHTSSSLSLTSATQGQPKQGTSSVENSLYRTSSCSDMDLKNSLSGSKPSHTQGSFTCHTKPPVSPCQWKWKESNSGSSQGLCCNPKETGKLRSFSWANRGQYFAQSSLPRAIPQFAYYRRYQTLSLASQDSQGSGRLAGTKQLSESRQLEWDMAVQAEFVNVCRQIDALSVCSDTIDL